MTINERIKKIRETFCNGDNKLFSSILGKSPQYISNLCNDGKKVGDKMLDEILSKFPQVNNIWLKMGDGEMIKDNAPKLSNNRLIPFYDDVSSIGGINEIRANTEDTHSPSEYIDAGDWFRDATAAIRHYGESMIEYPTGCILALKEVQDRSLIIPGRDYCIETSEYRVTKRVQKGNTPDYIMAYSTNIETYPDGRQIHEPFDIPLNSISKIFLVLGYVVKKNGGTLVFNASNK